MVSVCEKDVLSGEIFARKKIVVFFLVSFFLLFFLINFFIYYLFAVIILDCSDFSSLLGFYFLVFWLFFFRFGSKFFQFFL